MRACESSVMAMEKSCWRKVFVLDSAKFNVHKICRASNRPPSCFWVAWLARIPDVAVTADKPFVASIAVVRVVGDKMASSNSSSH